MKLPNFSKLKKLNYDKIFLRLIIASASVVVIIFSTLYIAWIFELDLQSSYLWLAALFMFVSFFSIYIAPFYWKVVIIAVAIGLITFSLVYNFDIPLVFAVMVGLAIVIMMLSVYLSI